MYFVISHAEKNSLSFSSKSISRVMYKYEPNSSPSQSAETSVNGLSQLNDRFLGADLGRFSLHDLKDLIFFSF